MAQKYSKTTLSSQKYDDLWQIQYIILRVTSGFISFDENIFTLKIS